MELDDLLGRLDQASANLSRAEVVWARAEPALPRGATWDPTTPQYADLARAWSDLIANLPPLEGWTITAQLPDPGEAGSLFFDYLEADATPFSLLADLERPGRDLAEYRFRLARARRSAIRTRLAQLTSEIEGILPSLLVGVARDSREVVENPLTAVVDAHVTEMQRLLGDATERRGRWSDLERHLRWNQGQDWHDIAKMDWPSVKADIDAALHTGVEPIPTPTDVDLGVAAVGLLSGAVTTALNWSAIDADQFERLLLDLLARLSLFQNPALLTHLNAADRGRDLSCERVIPDGAGGVRTERILVQAKHWRSRSLGVLEVSGNVAQAALWTPPLVHSLIIATSGHFSSDAVRWVETHNEKGQLPLVELWPEVHLERLLSAHPDIAAGYGLR
jgi:hypothetical protein